MHSAGGAVPVKVLPRAAFALAPAREALACIVVPDWQLLRPSTARQLTATGLLQPPPQPSARAPQPATLELAIARLASLLDTDDTVLVRVAGGLLRYLRESRLLPDDDSSRCDSASGDAALASLLDGENEEVGGGGKGGGMGGGMGGGGEPSAAIFLRGGLHVFALGAHLQMDRTTVAALGILPAPSAVGSGGGSIGGVGGGSGSSSNGARDGLSLLRLLDRTRSAPGRRLLRSWLLAPSMDLSVLRHRHDAVALLVAAHAQAPGLIAELHALLRGARDVSRLLLRIKRVAASPADWAGVQRASKTALAAKSVVKQLLRAVRMPAYSTAGGAGGGADASARIGHGMASGHYGDDGADGDGSAQRPQLLAQVLLADDAAELEYVTTLLDAVVDWPASAAARRLCVRSGVDAALDEHRRVAEQLPDFLGGAAAEQLLLAPGLRSLSLKYLPQVGCVFCVDKADNGLLEEAAVPAAAPAAADASAAAADATTSAVNAPVASAMPAVFTRVAGSARTQAAVPADWQLSFETAEALHYKGPFTDGLDADVGDIAAITTDLEAAVCRALEDRLLEQESALLAASARLAEVDVLAAFAEVAVERRYCRPELVEDAVLFARHSRHPLQELTVAAFVPNDVALAPAGRHTGIAAMAVITGPNYSGKSVYIKTVGLLAVMAQAGSFVPAHEARLGIVDRLFTRVHSLETSTLGLSSAFAIDLNQVGLMLKHATPRSLLLVDEFGKGTATVDGVALLAAAIRYFLRAPSVPRAVVATHFREVFDDGLLVVRSDGGTASDVAFFQMQVLLSRSAAATTAATAAVARCASGSVATYEDDVTPLFRLVPGRAGASYGLACALRAGMPRRITDRAAAVADMLRSGSQVAPLPAYHGDAGSLLTERALVRMLQALLSPEAWLASESAGAGSSCEKVVASTIDVATMLSLVAAVGNGDD